MSSLSWLLQVAGLCVVPLALMAGAPRLELRILAIGAGCFLVGRWLGRKGA